jgi:flagellar motor protein MotB
MKYHILRRSRLGEENPTWPGLVDLFAFGMAIMVVLVVLNAQFRSWQEQAAAERKSRISEIMSAIIDKDSTMVHYARLDSAANSIKVDEIEGGPIRFEKSRFDLSAADDARLGKLAATMEAALATDNTAVVAINGTADPDRMNHALPPRDNVELSALRAAAVARVFRVKAPKLTDAKRVQVIGLGEDGEAVADSSFADKEAKYQQYRTVRLEIRIDANRLVATERGGK